MELPRDMNIKLSIKEVFDYLFDYVQKKGLNHPVKKSYIIPDARLEKLLEFDDDCEESKGLNYFNITDYLKKHFLFGNAGELKSICYISNKMADFFGIEKGIQQNRIEIQKLLNKYIKQNNLHDPKNGSFIIPNEPLRNLLEIPSDFELSFFNLHKFMKNHIAENYDAALVAGFI